MPGFEDTLSMEIDIATSIWLTEIAKRAKSIRFVALTSCTSLREDRGGSMRVVASFISNIISDFKKFQKSFCFLFSL
jgi:hypothetical protein